MLGNQQIFEHQSTGKEAKDKKRGLPVILQCVLCYAAKSKKGGGGRGINQKHEWNHTFKRTTSDSIEA